MQKRSVQANNLKFIYTKRFSQNQSHVHIQVTSSVFSTSQFSLMFSNLKQAGSFLLILLAHSELQYQKVKRKKIQVHVTF